MVFVGTGSRRGPGHRRRSRCLHPVRRLQSPPCRARPTAGLPHLQLVNTEGVGFDKVDCEAAAEHAVFVCNNAGGNAHAVAEQAILLMLGLLRHVRAWDQAVRDGRQFEAKIEGFAKGITDLADCTVGIIGLGHSGRARPASAWRPSAPGALHLAHAQDPRIGAAIARGMAREARTAGRMRHRPACTPP